MSSHSFFQGLFLTQGSNPDPLHCRQILYCLSHQRSPYIHICVCAWVYVYIYIRLPSYIYIASQMALQVKNPHAKARDAGLIPELGRSPGGGHGNPLQYSCLENSIDRRSLVGCSSWGGRVGHDWAHTHTNIQISESLGCILKTNTIFVNHLYVSKREFFLNKKTVFIWRMPSYRSCSNISIVSLEIPRTFQAHLQHSLGFQPLLWYVFPGWKNRFEISIRNTVMGKTKRQAIGYFSAIILHDHLDFFVLKSLNCRTI